MSDSSSAGGDEADDGTDPGGTPDGQTATQSREEPDTDEDIDALRRRVEEEYDFENFGPSDMREMSGTEWEAAFDPDTWITGTDLLDRVEADLRRRIATRDVFAVLERVEDPDRVIAYSDEGYAVVHPDGSLEGEGTVLRDVKPTVVLCSLDSYDVEEPPRDYELPDPEEVKSGTGEFGNTVLQVVAFTQILAGFGLLGLFLLTDFVPITVEGELNIAPPIAAFLFLGIGFTLLIVVANARLSDRFRVAEYRDRLQAAGLADGDRPEFVPFEEIRDGELPETAPSDTADRRSGSSASGSEGQNGSR